MRVSQFFLLAAFGLSACAHRRPATVVTVEAPTTEPSKDWRSVASVGDRERIEGLSARLATAERTTRTNARRPPVTPQSWPAPTPGVYRCRVHRKGIGWTRPAGSRSFFCYIQADGNFLTFSKGTGSERPSGRLWPDGEARFVFLGGTPARPDTPAAPYGASPATDRIGVFERTADFRWRLILDRPIADRLFDVIELWPDPATLPMVD